MQEVHCYQNSCRKGFLWFRSCIYVQCIFNLNNLKVVEKVLNEKIYHTLTHHISSPGLEKNIFRRWTSCPPAFKIWWTRLKFGGQGIGAVIILDHIVLVYIPKFIFNILYFYLQ